MYSILLTITSLLLLGCILEPEPEMTVISCRLATDTVDWSEDPVPPIPDTVKLSDGKCETYHSDR